jgi:transcriptional regulator with XRE-family HTH domain
MTSAEFRVALDSLRLRQNKFAKLMSVSARTVSTWATGQAEVPGPVTAYLRVLNLLTERQMEREMGLLMADLVANIEGTYRFDYEFEGRFGTGIALLEGGKILGEDIGDATYNGEYQYNRLTGKIEIAVSMKIPAGGQLVTGLAVTNDGHRLPLAFAIAVPAKGSPSQVAVEVAGKFVNVAMTLLRPKTTT